MKRLKAILEDAGVFIGAAFVCTVMAIPSQSNLVDLFWWIKDFFSGLPLF